MRIQYQTSVYTAAGWRPVTVTADAELVSPKMAAVLSVVDIDGEAPVGYTSRTGAKRQQYHARGIALREVGARKRISSLTVLES